MEEEQQNMQFGLEEDYEGGVFINDEFYAVKDKRKRAQTKEEALYGMFISDSDEEDSRTSRKRKQQVNLQQPLAFVSKGVVLDQDTPQAVFEPSKKLQQQNTSEEEEFLEQDNQAGSSYQKTIYENAVKRQKYKEEEKVKQKQRQERISKSGERVGAIQSWDKGGKIANMMAKMGWQPGAGLGKSQQGIAKPVQAQLRPKNVGIGFGNFAQPVQEEELKTNLVKQQQPQKQPRRRNWLKDKNQSKGKADNEYKSTRQLLQEKQENSLGTQSTMIIDMRGPHAKVLTSMQDIDEVVQTGRHEDLPFPELQHNVRLLIDMVEVEVIQTTEKIEQEKDRLLVESRELERLELKEEQTTKTLECMTEIYEQVQQLWASADQCNLEDLRTVLCEIKERFPEEYVLYDVRNLAAGIALPKFRKLFASWNPLMENEITEKLMGELLSWRTLLEYDGQTGSRQSEFSRLAREVLLPRLRVGLAQWEPRNPETILQFLETWCFEDGTRKEHLLPQDVVDQLLSMLILPRIQLAVNSWNPTQERVAIHQWIHPWLPYLGPQLAELYPTIRHRLANALRNWHPADSSALLILKPWKRVFKPEHWNGLMMNCILPKLAESLDSLHFSIQVLPQLQLPLPPPLQQTQAWVDILAIEQVIMLFEAHFLQRWHECLQGWLLSLKALPIVQQNEHILQARRWYSGWKEFIQMKFPEIADHQQIKAHFNTASEAFNLMENGQLLQENYPFPAPFANTVQLQFAQQQAQVQSVQQPPLVPQTAQISLREMVEHYASAHNLEFVPKVGRVHEGLQVYSFGRVSIIVNEQRQIILGQVGDGWIPMHLDSLMNEHRSRLGSF